MRRVAFCAVAAASMGTATLAHADEPPPTEDFEYVDEVGDSWPGPPGDETVEYETADDGQLSPPAPRGFDYRALERSVHDEMNLMRQNPAAYADKIAARRSTYRGKIRYPGQGQPIMTNEGVAALDEAVNALRNQGRLPRLAWSDALHASANGHATDLNKNNLVGHAGSDGSQPENRVGRVGKVDGWVAENIAFGPRTGEDVVIGLIVDDGVADRGHREVLVKPDLFVAGTACGPHPAYGVVCVINYATRLTTNGSVVAAAPAIDTQVDVAEDRDWEDGVDGDVDVPELGQAPVWGAPTDTLPPVGAAADMRAPFDADDEAPVADDADFVCPYDTPSANAPVAPANVAPAAPVPQPAPLQQLLDDRYPADHPRNQPPERRQVRRPIMRTEGNHYNAPSRPRRDRRGYGWRGYDY